MAALKVGIPLYENFDSLDVLGPWQTFTFAQYDCYLVAESCDLVTSFEGVSVKPTVTFDDCPQLDILLVPGGSNPVQLLTSGPADKNPYLQFLVAQANGKAGAAGAQWVCSVCTGALLLAGAGLLDGHTVTTHWAFKEILRLFPVHVVDDYRRYVQSGNRLTGGGISSGLDLALYLVGVVSGVGTARQGQLAMQYNPQPAFHCGDPDDTDIKDDPGMVEERKQTWQIAQQRETVKKWLGK